MSRRVLVFGKNGNISRALAEAEPTFSKDFEFLHLDHEVCNFLETPSVTAWLDRVKPDIVINAAAYTQVERAEDEPEIARQINALTPAIIAGWCKDNGAPLVHYSSDYVFSGEGPHEALSEETPPGPLSAYGRSKFEGEQLLLGSGCEGLLLRTSWIFHFEGQNFLHSIHRLTQRPSKITVVDDQFGSPTFALTLARATLEALVVLVGRRPFPMELFHLSGGGTVSWYEFASKIFSGLKKRGIPMAAEGVFPIRTWEYPLRAKRPSFSALNSAKIRRELGIDVGGWEPQLEECLDRFVKMFNRDGNVVSSS